MANAPQATAKKMKMAERAQQQMDIHFPGFQAPWIWLRKANDGFTTMPRTMPIIMQAIDAQSKGRPAGHTLMCLWARAPDHPVLMIESPAVFASEAGFAGERAVDTWRKRMKELRDMWMIRSAPGPSGEFHYVLLTNPNAAMEWLRLQGKVQDSLYSRFVDRLAIVGGFGEVEMVRAAWKVQVDQAAAAALAAAAAGAVPAPPAPLAPAPIPVPGQPPVKAKKKRVRVS